VIRFVLFCCRYTSRFDQVDLESVVDKVADLPDPVVS
jgi:hypothetical protein